MQFNFLFIYFLHIYLNHYVFYVVQKEFVHLSKKKLSIFEHLNLSKKIRNCNKVATEER